MRKQFAFIRLKRLLAGIILVAFCLANAGAEARSDIPDLESIHVLDLKTAARIALADHPSLAAAEARVRQAKAAVRQARAGYWPRLDASAAGSRVSLSDSEYEANLGTAQLIYGASADIDDPEDYYSAGLTASWVLFDGFERRFSTAAARYGYEQSQFALRDVRRLLISAVADAYFLAQLARENMAITQADVSFNLRQLAEADARHRVGTGSLSDVLNFKVRVNSAKSERISSERSLAQARIGLAALMGLPDAGLPAHLPLADLSPETVEELASPLEKNRLDDALAHRPDIHQARFFLQQAQARVQVAKAPYYPTIRFSASLEGDRAGDAGFEDEDFGNTVAVNLSCALFEGGLRKAVVAEAREKAVELERQLSDTRLSVVSEVRDAVVQVTAAQQQLRMQRENAKLVRQNRDLVEKEYLAGQGSLVRLNEAQRDLITAQSRLALALVSLRRAWIALETATGSIPASVVD